MTPRHAFHLLLGAIVATAVIIYLPSTTSAAETTVNNAWAQAFNAVEQGNGSALASGVVSAHGNPSVGATVVLWAQPTDGSDPVAVSRTITDSTGHWAVSMRSDIDMTFARNAQTQQINFFVESFDGIGSSEYYFPAIIGSTTSDPATNSTGSPNDPATAIALGGTIAAKAIGLWVDRQQTTGVALTSTDIPNVAVSKAVADGGAAPRTACTSRQIGSSNVWTQIAYLASEAWGSAEHLVYNYGASTQLGVGVQISGGWSASGTVAVNSAITANFPAIHNEQYVNYLAETRTKLLERTCRGRGISSTHDVLQADYLTGGLKYISAPRTAMGQCVVGPSRTTVTVNRSRAATFDAGFNVASLIGINLSAQTGFSSGTSIDFAFGAQSHPWCGLDAYPGKVGANPHKYTIHASVIS